MSFQTHGYDVSLGYSYGFCREMAPDWLDFCARLAGFAPRPRAAETPFRFLELGCGQGVGLCLLAAANPQGEFVGVDFLPEQIAHAQGLAESAGLANVRFAADDFVDLAAEWPADLGKFDYVAMHGVYTWVAPKVRAAIVACLAQATVPGALVYNGYNVLPGWLGAMPFQHFAQRLKETTAQAGGDALSQAVALFEDLQAGQCDTFRFLPGLTAQLDAIKTKKLEYLVHEYLHEGWEPQWHSDVAREFAGADLTYVGTATIAEAVLPAVLPAPLRDAILAQPDSGLRQDLQDFVINQSFRRDLSCRGPRGDVRHDMAAIGRARVSLTLPPSPGADVIVTPAFGEIRLEPPGFAAVLDALAAGPRTIDELAGLPEAQRQGPENFLQVLLMLAHARVLTIGGSGMSVATAAAARLNAAIARGASEGRPYDHLAAPAAGSAFAVSEIELLLFDSWLASSRSADPAIVAVGAAERMARLERTLGRDGRVLDERETRAQLAGFATLFLDQILPRWRGLGAVD